MQQQYLTRHLTARDLRLLDALDQVPRYKPIADRLRRAIPQPQPPEPAGPSERMGDVPKPQPQKPSGR